MASSATTLESSTSSCEVRLIGHARSRVGPTETSKCVGPTYTIFDFSGTSYFNAAPSSDGAAASSGLKVVAMNSTTAGSR